MAKRLVEYESFKDNPFDISVDKLNFSKIAINYRDIISESTGEIVKKHEMRLVDRKPYIKLFKEAIPIFQELSVKSHRVLYEVLGDLKKGEDDVYLNASSLASKFDLKNTRDVLSGIKELLDKNILCRKTGKDMYFINVRLIFNGNRVPYYEERFK